MMSLSWRGRATRLIRSAARSPIRSTSARSSASSLLIQPIDVDFRVTQVVKPLAGSVGSQRAAATRPSFWTLDRVADALASVAVTPQPRGSTPLSAVNTDTRSVAAQNLFVALRGERFDAHEFLADAVSKGAAALVVSDAKAAATLGVPVFV